MPLAWSGRATSDGEGPLQDQTLVFRKTLTAWSLRVLLEGSDRTDLGRFADRMIVIKAASLSHIRGRRMPQNP
jgi:hypothetical protein